MKDDSQITILVPLEDEVDNEYRNVLDTLRGRYKAVEIPSSNLSESVESLFKTVSSSFKAAQVELQGLELDEIEFNAAITINGKLSLIAGELQGGYQGSIKFKFKRFRE